MFCPECGRWKKSDKGVASKKKGNVSYTQITISQDRGVDREPLTLIRTVVPDDANYQLIHSLQRLALAIRHKHIPLHQAEACLEKIICKQGRSPRLTSRY